MTTPVSRKYVLVYVYILLASSAMLYDAKRILSLPAALASKAHATRVCDEYGCDWKETDKWSVEILLTRHGLSCANIPDKFNSGWVEKKTHLAMTDPLLTTVGAKESILIGKKVQEKLSHKKWKVDVLMSSVLARAMQTAKLQFPDAGPVYVMPYIRESAGPKFIGGHGGLDNEVTKLKNGDWSPKDQIKAIQEFDQNLPGRLQPLELNLTFATEKEGTWEDFETYLESTVLPHFVKKGSKRLVLAVVSHSNFMNQGKAFERCSDEYHPDPSSKKNGVKSWNNQVVHMHYVFEKKRGSALPDLRDLKRHEAPYFTSAELADAAQDPDNHGNTTEFVYKHLLKYNGSCTGVVDGLSIKDNITRKLRPLCDQDIGRTCMDQIPKIGYPSTIDRQIQKTQVDIAKGKDDLSNFKRALKALAEEKGKLEKDQMNNAEYVPGWKKAFFGPAPPATRDQIEADISNQESKNQVWLAKLKSLQATVCMDGATIKPADTVIDPGSKKME